MNKTHYSKAEINNSIRSLLESGRSNDDALDCFLQMNMMNDLEPERPFVRMGPSPSEVHMHLIGNDVIDKDDIKLEMTNAKKSSTQRLVVRLSSSCTLYAEQSYDSLQVTVNEKNLTVMYLKYFRAEDIALWMIRQKQKLNEYIEAWDAVLAYACKKVKIDHMAFLGIRAIFTEAMKDYPRIKFAVIEQKRRAKIMVNIPNTDLGVYIYAWWGSYKKQLPEQIESLKVLLDAHRKSSLKNFFIHR